MAFFQLIAGFALLLIGGEFLVKAAVSLAKRLKLSEALIGVTIVAYGTSLPELMVTAKAVLNGYDQIA